MEIDEITTWAKKFLLKDGTHDPTLFVETDAPQVIVAGLANMPAALDIRMSYFLAVGRKFATDHPGEQMHEVAFIELSWASKQLPGQSTPKHRPAQDPNRTELLTISHLTANADHSVKLDGQSVEIIRDNKGKLRDLLPLPTTAEDGQSPLLVLFLLGFRYPELSEREIKQLLRDTMGLL